MLEDTVRRTLHVHHILVAVILIATFLTIRQIASANLVTLEVGLSLYSKIEAFQEIPKDKDVEPGSYKLVLMVILTTELLMAFILTTRVLVPTSTHNLVEISLTVSTITRLLSRTSWLKMLSKVIFFNKNYFSVSYASEIEVTMYNQKVHIDRSTRNAYFNGYRIHLPYYYPSKSMQQVAVTYSGSTFYVRNDQLVTVKFTTGGQICIQVRK